MALYQIPEEYYFRVHHPRPRFKNNIENVLIYMATEIVKIGELEARAFKQELNNAIRLYPGNYLKAAKTINNWRTEIDALFCFIEEEGNYLKPSRRANEFATSQDLVKFFKLFCYFYQLPGGFIKPERNLDCIKNNIDFRPACYIVQMLSGAEISSGARAGLSKAEATHCIFNDLRVTRDHRSTASTWALIVNNRESGKEYDNTGDVIRYAGDILDYMEKANLIVRRPDGKYYLNPNEGLAHKRFLEPDEGFDYYSKLGEHFSIRNIKLMENDWVRYFNQDISDEYFDTDLLALLAETEEQYTKYENIIKDIEDILQTADPGQITAKAIGDIGENLTYAHEINRITMEGRPDLAHLVVLIPDNFSIGYDIKSVEFDERQRFIEVKTTLSPQAVQFNRFHLTTNEWNAAKTQKDRYYVYRLLVSKGQLRLVLIQDPVGLFLESKITGTPRNGMDFIFDPSMCGEEVELLIERAV